MDFRSTFGMDFSNTFYNMAWVDGRCIQCMGIFCRGGSHRRVGRLDIMGKVDVHHLGLLVHLGRLVPCFVWSRDYDLLHVVGVDCSSLVGLCHFASGHDNLYGGDCLFHHCPLLHHWDYPFGLLGLDFGWGDY